MNTSIEHLIAAEKKADSIFAEAEKRGYFSPGQTEKELNTKLYELAEELFGIKKYWHKRIVRSGKNTLCPYRENPPDLNIEKDDILFFDFGPVFEEWEADYGKSYVIGKDPKKLKLVADIETAWEEGRKYFLENKNITGAQFYAFTQELAKKMGWEYGNEHCGHLIGNFPHEKLQGEELTNYIHPSNDIEMREADKNGNPRFWIYEIHFVDTEHQFGGFFETLLV